MSISELTHAGTSASGTPEPIYSPAYAAVEFLRRKSPVCLTVPGLRRSDLERAWRGLEQFDAKYQDSEQKRWEFNVPRDPEYPEPDDGFIRKSRRDGKPDDKIYFHYRPDFPILAEERGLKIERWPWECLGACDTILGACVAEGFALAREMDSIWPEYNLLERLVKCRAQHVVRVLLYDQLDPDTSFPLAVPHEDRCGITLNVASSRPGFVSFRDDRRIEPPQCSFPNVLTFPGKQFERVTVGRVPALRHAVDNIPGFTGRRWAIVCFLKMNAL